MSGTGKPLYISPHWLLEAGRKEDMMISPILQMMIMNASVSWPSMLGSEIPKLMFFLSTHDDMDKTQAILRNQ